MFITRKIKNTFLIGLGIVILGWVGLPTAQVFAQVDDSFQEDDSFDAFQDEEFTDDLDLNEFDLEEEQTGFEEEQTGFEEEGQTDGYVDEDILPDNTQELLNEAARLRGAFLQQEKVNFVPNILYGVGTGLIIGGWFAILTAKASRDTLRSIGLGIVLGGVMGSVIGGRSVLTPDAPVPQEETLEPEPTGRIDLLPQEGKGLTLAFHWNF